MIDHSKLKRLKRQFSELDGAFTKAREEVEFLRYGVVSADGRYLQEPGLIPPLLMRLSGTDFNLPFGRRAELHELVTQFEKRFRGVDRTLMKLSEAHLLSDVQTARALVDAYERLAEAEAHVQDIVERRAPLGALIRSLDQYVGVDHGLVISLGVRCV